VLVQEVIAMFRAAATSAGVRLAARTLGGVPPLDVDPVRVREVLTNLVSNALRYSPGGGTVTVEIDPGEVVVRLRVSDEGPGVPAIDLPHVFDRFYKGTGSDGSGLGLTIARNLMLAHGGTLTAENRAEGGTTFSATLPIVSRES
jgi:two-component system, OmpR family, sensor histidine kinase BaeS